MKKQNPYKELVQSLFAGSIPKSLCPPRIKTDRQVGCASSEMFHVRYIAKHESTIASFTSKDKAEKYIQKRLVK